MGISDITDKIIADATAEAQEIARRAEAETEDIASETKREKEKMEHAHNAEVKRRSEDIERTLRSEAQQAAKRSRETVKEEAVTRVFERAHDELCNLNTDRYTAFITRCLNDVGPDVQGTLHTPTKRSEETQRALNDAGIAHLTVETDDELTGGFIIHGEKIRYDYSFETLVSTARERLTIAVTRKLFPTE